MADRPILFSGPMVRALLEGRKTQTRRVLNPQPKVLKNGSWYRPFPTTDPLNWQYALGDRIHGYLKASYAVGDRLWVREAWQTGMSGDGPQISYRATPDYCQIDAWDGPDEGAGPSFNYDRCPSAHFHHWLGDVLSNDGPWRPGIHMPRWASRLTLVVTDVRVQRLQEIGQVDAVAEGVPFTELDRTPDELHRAQFADLWDGLNAERGFGWDVNPWVVAVSFSVHRRNIDDAR